MRWASPSSHGKEVRALAKLHRQHLPVRCFMAAYAQFKIAPLIEKVPPGPIAGKWDELDAADESRFGARET
jgi:hypothetical protein